jgi:hypothetical protein
MPHAREPALMWINEEVSCVQEWSPLIWINAGSGGAERLRVSFADGGAA